MRSLAIATLLLASTTPPAFAQGNSTGDSPQAASTTKANPLDRMVCKVEETVGSRLNKKKVCLTVREWQDQAAANRVATEQFQGVGLGCPEGAGGPAAGC